ncbi:hypothetical protein H312_02096 [Anncaliia algerae PRA339]|uniref:Protein yippee-like n=1 Tax=Anncaliia algerae PRA339 TaxID=1288291 RepID=A0A059EZP2_9MICR|nr:hypothetical protein H312_02096 [Anncaliia algerae PRA339]
MSENTLQNPFVVQCKNCLRIVADSFSLLNFKKEILLFSSISENIHLNDKEKDSDEPYDYKCKYLDLECLCSNVIGRKYLSVNENIQEMMLKFCIYKKCVISYQLGSNIEIKEHTLSSLAEEVSKLQKFCVYLHNKLEKKQDH